MPHLRSRSLMWGTAAAASSRSTVMRTSSEPAPASAATCWAVLSTSAVSVLVIDCTTIGAPPPTRTPPTFTATVLWRPLGAARSDMLAPLQVYVTSAPRIDQDKPGPKYGGFEVP